MTYYLVDTENLGFPILGSEEDKCLYFMDKDYPFMQCDVNDTAIRVDTFHSTKNALDYCIDTYLGYLIATNEKETAFVIVSNDVGYDIVADFWQNMGYNVDRQSDFDECTEFVKPAEMEDCIRLSQDTSMGTAEQLVHDFCRQTRNMKKKYRCDKKLWCADFGVYIKGKVKGMKMTLLKQKAGEYYDTIASEYYY